MEKELQIMCSEDTILVYHGSDHIIQTPQYLGGKEDNDYGNGFYTTAGRS